MPEEAGSLQLLCFVLDIRKPAWRRTGAGATPAWSQEGPDFAEHLAGRWACHLLEKVCFPALLAHRELAPQGGAAHLFLPKPVLYEPRSVLAVNFRVNTYKNLS